MLMNNCMIWCTACEFNQKYYFNRIKIWYEMVKQFNNTDLYVIIDGSIIEPLPVIANNLHYIEIKPAIGRKTCWIFPGWKRSFKKALEISLKYEFVTHIESDITIINMNKFKEYIYQCGTFASFDDKYHFVEASCMILNDINSRQILLNKYSDEKNWYENIDFECWLSKIISFNFVFKSRRIENEIISKDKLQKYDLLAQTFGIPPIN